jgi:hypothetical protein
MQQVTAAALVHKVTVAIVQQIVPNAQTIVKAQIHPRR